MPDFDYSTNPFFTMLEGIKAHVKEHGSVVLVADDPFRREIGFSVDGNTRWALSLSKVKLSFMPDLDPENRLASYRMHMSSTEGRRNIAQMLSSGTAP
jgi:hypothetical protein